MHEWPHPGLPSADPAVRGETVAVLCKVIPYKAALGLYPFALTKREGLLLGWATDQDIDLAAGLLAAERADTEHKCAALERLLAAIPPGGTYDEVVYLPREQMRNALRDAITVGWLHDWDQYADPQE